MRRNPEYCGGECHGDCDTEPTPCQDSEELYTMKPYTVILQRPEYLYDSLPNTTTVAHIQATCPERAQQVAQLHLYDIDYPEPYERVSGGEQDYLVLFTIEGHHDDLTVREGRA